MHGALVINTISVWQSGFSTVAVQTYVVLSTSFERSVNMKFDGENRGKTLPPFIEGYTVERLKSGLFRLHSQEGEQKVG